jgi:hypothetical protein
MGLRAPVVNAPMGGAAGGRLATAVSAAGGLGMIGMGSAATPEALATELRLLDRHAGPFGIGLVHWVMAGRPELLEVALAARPALLSVSFGEDWDWVRHAHDAGVPVATQVATVDAARRAEDAGVDVLVARGAEGGGHGAPLLGTLPLLTGVLDAVRIPVLAAGGIASARGLAAVLAGCVGGLAGHRVRGLPAGADPGFGAGPTARRGADRTDLGPRHRRRIRLAGFATRAGAARIGSERRAGRRPARRGARRRGGGPRAVCRRGGAVGALGFRLTRRVSTAGGGSSSAPP